MFSALMALALMSTVNAMVTIGPRVYYAMAKNGAFLAIGGEGASALAHAGGCDCRAGRVHDADDLTPFPQLVIYIGFTLSFFAVMSVASLFYFRRQPGWQKLRSVSFCLAVGSGAVPDSGSVDGVSGIVQLKPIISLATVLTMVHGRAGVPLSDPVAAKDRRLGGGGNILSNQNVRCDAYVNAERRCSIIMVMALSSNG